jgi:hypothetical protein
MLRNAWATEVLLNAPRTLGDDLVTFANLWTPVPGYYAVFNSISALSHVVMAKPPHRHARLLSWAATTAASPRSPFPPPWTASVGGCPSAWIYNNLGPDPLNEKISNLVTPRVANAPSPLAMGLRTTRGNQITEHRAGWLKTLTTVAGKPRKVCRDPQAVVPLVTSGRACQCGRWNAGASRPSAHAADGLLLLHGRQRSPSCEYGAPSLMVPMWANARAFRLTGFDGRGKVPIGLVVDRPLRLPFSR